MRTKRNIFDYLLHSCSEFELSCHKTSIINFISFMASCLPSVLWRCWLGGRKGIRPVKTEWWDAGMVICPRRGADLHTAQLMPLPLTVSCFSKIQIGSGTSSPKYPGKSPEVHKTDVCGCYGQLPQTRLPLVHGQSIHIHTLPCWHI